MAEAAAREEGIPLDRTLSLADKGVSGFNSQNWKRGHLGKFLDLVDAGIVPQGSVLIIERVNCLSRLPWMEQVQLWKEILNRGIVIRTCEPASRPSALGEMVELIAELGGYLRRKHYGPPGPKVIWIGLQEFPGLRPGLMEAALQAAGRWFYRECVFAYFGRHARGTLLSVNLLWTRRRTFGIGRPLTKTNSDTVHGPLRGGSGAAGIALGEGAMLMRRLGGAAAVLVLGLTVSARAADNGAAPSGGGHWWDKVNPFADKKADAPAVPPTVPLTANAAAAALKPVVARESEEAAWIRRTDVCDKLKQIALDTNNVELERQAELLQQRVDELHRTRTSAAANRFESDEAELNKHLGGVRTATVREGQE